MHPANPDRSPPIKVDDCEVVTYGYGDGEEILFHLNGGPGLLQGPNEFLYTGNRKTWNRIDDLARVTVPALVLVGQHDELTPACALRMHNALPNSEIKVFPNSSHMPFHEEPEAYFATLSGFPAKHGVAPVA